mgnify:CR=1 FL=1
MYTLKREERLRGIWNSGEALDGGNGAIPADFCVQAALVLTPERK